MATPPHRIAINSGGGYVPGLSAVVTGAVLAASPLGIETVGIRDGYDGLLNPEEYRDGGLITLDPHIVDNLGPDSGSVLGTAARHDPFRMRTINPDGFVEEVDYSDELLQRIRANHIDGVISIAGGSSLTGSHALSVAFKLSRKGLATVCVPKSVENDIAPTTLAFGYNSALSYAAESLVRIRTAARDARRLAVVEVLGQQAGWLALQSGITTCADAVLIPEIRYDLRAVAAHLHNQQQAGRAPSLVVVAEGAMPKDLPEASSPHAPDADGLRKSLTPFADVRYGEGARVIDRSGTAAGKVALELQQLTDYQTLPLELGQLVRGAASTALDRQLGLSYGAAAVLALNDGNANVMLAFDPPELTFVPLAEAINKVRTVPLGGALIRIARSLGICLGD
jgi:6-phosphofructokinase 1